MSEPRNNHFRLIRILSHKRGCTISALETASLSNFKFQFPQVVPFNAASAVLLVNLSATSDGNRETITLCYVSELPYEGRYTDRLLPGNLHTSPLHLQFAGDNSGLVITCADNSHVKN